jgi:bacterioferritin-associated ferredoxin
VIKAEIPNKVLLSFIDGMVSYVGPQELWLKVLEQKKQNGVNPEKWKPVQVENGHDVLLNEFILKCQKNYKIPYVHEEFCHCRMVPTEKVLHVIKQGIFTTAEVGRVTMAGTGCGSCKKDIEELTKYLIK